MAEEALRRAAREVTPWIERTARLGYASIGAVYIVVGLLTAGAAIGFGGKAANWTDAIATVRAVPLGNLALEVIAIGLLGYSAWLLSSAVTDSEEHGSDAKGLARRAGEIGSAIIHISIALSVLRFAVGRTTLRSGSDQNARQWTAHVMKMPLGRWLVAIGGAALLAYAAYALTCAWQAKLGQHLHLPQTSGRSLIVAICRFGIAARAAIAGVIGISLIAAAIHQNPARSEATRGAFLDLSRAPLGHLLLTIVSLGFVAYGVYELVKARYRSIRAA
jgi:hypothetical protein